MKNTLLAAVIVSISAVQVHAEFQWTRTHTGSFFDLYSIESGKASRDGDTEKISAHGFGLYGGGYNSSTDVFYEVDGTALVRILLALLGEEADSNKGYDMSMVMFRYGGGIGEKFVLGLDMDWRLLNAKPVYDSQVFGFGPFLTTEFVFLDGLHWWPLAAFQVMFTNRQEEPVDGSGFKLCNHFVKTITERWGVSLRIDRHWRTLKTQNGDDEMKVKSSLTQISFGLGYCFE